MQNEPTGYRLGNRRMLHEATRALSRQHGAPTLRLSNRPTTSAPIPLKLIHNPRPILMTADECHAILRETRSMPWLERRFVPRTYEPGRSEWRATHSTKKKAETLTTKKKK